MTEKITIHVAKTNLSKLIAKAEAGEEIVIYRGDKPAAKLVPANDAKKVLPNRGFGNLKGVIEFDDRFFDPLPEEMLLKPTKKPAPKK
ncbi:MAG TPA: type II toxin-antitoxin system prevent-host-death family antitoxin [Terricaulis sp.]|nr:type II toxin-antitoxin system prevent-host-death family antitoxin [Terricaulis sp.]